MRKVKQPVKPNTQAELAMLRRRLKVHLDNVSWANPFIFLGRIAMKGRMPSVFQASDPNARP
jgi:hypothetical protein